MIWSEPQPGACVDDLAATLTERDDPYQRQALQSRPALSPMRSTFHVSGSFRATLRMVERYAHVDDAELQRAVRITHEHADAAI